jgi:hypothetical protein
MKNVRAYDYDPEVRTFRAVSADPRLPALKAALDTARAKLKICELELAAAEKLEAGPSAAALDNALKAITSDALGRGDIIGAIAAIRMNPSNAHQD